MSTNTHPMDNWYIDWPESTLPANDKAKTYWFVITHSDHPNQILAIDFPLTFAECETFARCILEGNKTIPQIEREFYCKSLSYFPSPLFLIEQGKGFRFYGKSKGLKL